MRDEEKERRDLQQDCDGGHASVLGAAGLASVLGIEMVSTRNSWTLVCVFQAHIRDQETVYVCSMDALCPSKVWHL